MLSIMDGPYNIVLVVKIFHRLMDYPPLYDNIASSEHVCIYLNFADNYCLRFVGMVNLNLLNILSYYCCMFSSNLTFLVNITFTSLAVTHKHNIFYTK